MSQFTELSDPRLQVPYELSEARKRQFREEGFIKLKDVFSKDVLDEYGDEITRLTLAHAPQKPLAERDTYGRAFIQVGSIWKMSDMARAFTFSKRLARLAAELMSVAGVRLYHDQALYKEAGGGFTPWHVDQQYWPLSSGKSVTAWVPFQAVPIDMGPLCFGKGSHLKNIGRDLAISDESERQIREAVKRDGVIETFEPYDLGEISFHLGWTLHRAGPNMTGIARKVHTIIYIDQQMKLAEPKNPNQQHDANAWAPGIAVGQVMASAMNPVLYSAGA
jgi:ectoine hydroxylase-related dioxygenase (phytanoyl-CoA dioxygenase family)